MFPQGGHHSFRLWESNPESTFQTVTGMGRVTCEFLQMSDWDAVEIQIGFTLGGKENQRGCG